MEEKTIAQAARMIAQKRDNAGTCVLALMDAQGYPTAATISVSRAEGIRWITFCTGLESNWAHRAQGCNRASVCFSEAYNITLVGTIEVLTDLRTKQAMWYDGMKAYFTGPEDPGFCVLRFQTQRYSLMLNEQEGNVRGTL